MESDPDTIRKAYADTQYGQIHYRYKPARANSKENGRVVMLHKSASSSASYESLMKQLAAEGYTCYALDMPGFGASFDPSPAAIKEIETKGTQWYVEVFAEALGKITGSNLKAPTGHQLHLIGHHSGASLAPELAARYPELVSSVTLVGTAVMGAEERSKMKEKYFAPFNKPVEDGTHLIKTWDYLRTMGIGGDIGLYQREAVDHIRAWKGRNQIYGAVWGQELSDYLDVLKCPVMFICARDDVLWDYQERAKERWTKAKFAECKGANFSLDLDSEGIKTKWLDFIEKK